MSRQNTGGRQPFKFGKTRLIKEDPDYVDAKWLNWSDSDAYPFVIDNNITRIWMGKEAGGQHIDMMNKDENGEYASSVHTRKNAWQGRLWRRWKVMSFWRVPTPEQAKRIVDLMNRWDNSVDYGEYYLENADEKLVKLKDYIKGEDENKPDLAKFRAMCDRMGVDCDELFREIDAIAKAENAPQDDAGHFDLSKIHTLNGALKSQTPQMKAYLQARIDNIAARLGTPRNSREVPQVEYNHYRRYGMGESVIKENPDGIRNNHLGVALNYDDNGAYPFIITKDYSRAWFGLESDTHDYVTYDEEDPEYEEAEEEGYVPYIQLDHGRTNSYHGRIWVDDKVISFWDVLGDGDLGNTIDIKRAVQALMKCPTYEQELFGDLLDYHIDIGDRNPMPTVREYLNGNFNPDGETKPETFDKATQHVRTDIDRKQDPDMAAYLQNRDSRQSERLGNMSQAEYNHLRRYGMGEGIERVDEVRDSDISLSSFKVKDELHPKFWVNDKLNSRVRLRLLDIADDFIKEMAVDWVKPSDIVITGSIANYNWSKYSDIDVHILIDFSKVWNKRKDFVEDYFKSKKEQWAAAHPKLSIYGFPVEVYVEDTDSDNPSTGIYSLEKNKWIKDPVDFQDAKLNERYIKEKSAEFMNEIDRICKAIDKTKDNHRYEKLGKEMYDLFKKLKKLRAEGLKSKGEMSSGNIIWKVCRRMGYIEKMWDVVNKAYDRINSIRESRLTEGSLLFEGMFDQDTRGWVNIGVVKDYCPFASSKFKDSYLMADPNAEQTEDKNDFRYRHMAFSPVPEGFERSYTLPNYYLQRLEIYPEFQDTYYGECVLGKKSSKEQMERDYFDFAMKLNRDGNEVILQHYSPVQIKDGFIGGSHPQQRYSNNSDVGTYFWGSPMAGSDPSNVNQYIYYCRVPLKDIYDFQHNHERLTLSQAMSKHKYAAQYWKNSDAVCVNTWCKTPIWFVKDKQTGKCYDANWNQIRDPFA